MFEGLGIDWTQVEFVEEAPIVLKAKPFRSVQEIKVAVARRYKITVSDLEGDSRKQAFAHPRQIAMALAYRRLKRFGYSLPVIGKHFGDRDHTTVLYAYRKMGTKHHPHGSRGAYHIKRRALDRRAS